MAIVAQRVNQIDALEFTSEQRRRVDEARDAFHRATLDVLKEQGVDYGSLDITEVGESIALEGMLHAS